MSPLPFPLGLFSGAHSPFFLVPFPQPSARSQVPHSRGFISRISHFLGALFPQCFYRTTSLSLGIYLFGDKK